MWLEIILQLPWLAFDMLLWRSNVACPECGVGLYRVRSCGRNNVLRCKSCGKSWVKDEGGLRPLVPRLERDKNGMARSDDSAP